LTAAANAARSAQVKGPPWTRFPHVRRGAVVVPRSCRRTDAANIEQSRRLPLPLVEAITEAGLFRLWIPRSLGGEETDPMTLVRVVEEVSRADGAAGWCVAIGAEYGVFGGYLPAEAAREIYGSDRSVRTAGALRPFGDAIVVPGGYRVTGRWPLGSGCQHSGWIVGGCRVLEDNKPRLRHDGTPVARLLFFSASDCEIIDTWNSIGLRGTGSHDYAVSDVFVPEARSLSFREPPLEPGVCAKARAAIRAAAPKFSAKYKSWRANTPHRLSPNSRAWR
jgi:alkylation response protein AidB-like acyl-CoA dehydrogenase